METINGPLIKEKLVESTEEILWKSLKDNKEEYTQERYIEELTLLGAKELGLLKATLHISPCVMPLIDVNLIKTLKQFLKINHLISIIEEMGLTIQLKRKDDNIVVHIFGHMKLFEKELTLKMINMLKSTLERQGVAYETYRYNRGQYLEIGALFLITRKSPTGEHTGDHNEKSH